MLQTISKAGQILNLFTVERPEWGVSEIAQVLGLPKSSASVLVSTLAEQGLLHRTRTRRYRLGWRVLSLSRVLLETTGFGVKARQEMMYLSTRFGETVYLGVLEGGEVVIIDTVRSGKASAGFAGGSGTRYPAPCNALGKIMLAHRPWAEVADMVVGSETQGSAPSLDKLLAELEISRGRGYACDVEGTVPGHCWVGAAILDHSGEAVAAMGFSVPAFRFGLGRDRYAAAILQAANTVSRCLGGSEAPSLLRPRSTRISRLLQTVG